MIIETKNFKISKSDNNGYITSIIGDVKSVDSKASLYHASLEDALLRGMSAHALKYASIPKELITPAIELYDKKILRPAYHMFKSGEAREMILKNDIDPQDYTETTEREKEKLSKARLYMALAFDERVNKNGGKRIKTCIGKAIKKRDKFNSQFNRPNYKTATSTMLYIANLYSREAPKFNDEHSRKEGLIAVISGSVANLTGIMSDSFQSFKSSISEDLFTKQVGKNIDTILSVDKIDIDCFISKMIHAAEIIDINGPEREDELLNIASEEFGNDDAMHDESYYGSFALAMVDHSECLHLTRTLNTIINAAIKMDQDLSMDNDTSDYSM